MPKRQVAERIVVSQEEPAAQPDLASLGVVAAALAGIAGAWISAGSLGLISQPLRNGLYWITLGAILLAAWPKGQRPWIHWALLALAVVTALVLAIPTTPVYGVLGITLVLAVLARLLVGVDRQVLLLTALAAAVLGVFRLALVSIPTVWSMANAFGHVLGQVVAALAGKPLQIGATFAGLELLVPTVVVYAGWLRGTAPPRRARALYAAAAIVAVEVGYLLLLASATDLEAALPAAASPPQDSYSEFYSPPDWQWSQALAAMLRWNLPLAAALADLIVLGLMFRWAQWLPTGQRRSAPAMGRPQGLRPLMEFGPPLLALLLPVAVVLSPDEAELRERKIVAYDRGRLDWDKPVHGDYGRQSAGMYGMLPQFVQSLGGRFTHSAELAQEDLRQADVLVLLHPDSTWPREQLERVWRYVRDGGSLLLVTGPGEPLDQMTATVNQLLEPCAMKVRCDTALCPTPYWQCALDVSAHPATAGIDDRHNGFGFLLGSSIRVAWPARPLLVGRYGWSDPGPDAALNMAYRFDAGEPLGDVVLAAEQPLGRGTVVVLADPYRLTNEGNVSAFPFTGRLLSYLAGRPNSPQSGWRQALGILAGVLLIGLMFWRFDPSQVALVAVALGASLAVTQSASGGPWSVLPDGRRWQPNPVAYIDASHLEAFSEESWRFDDLAGLKLTLMRNGYLPLMAPDLAPQRLERASLLISIAPARAFSETERKTIRQFVQRGGIFISMVGGPGAGPSATLLADFGFRVPPSMLPAIASQEPPRHERHFRARYLDAQTTGNYDCFVWFNAAWPIECSEPDTTIITRDFDDRPILAVRKFGDGTVAIIGDTGFAMNKNLEYTGGEPFEGGYENAHFWRWFFTYLNGQPAWIPPAPPTENAEETIQPEPGAAEGAAPQAATPEREENSP